MDYLTAISTYFGVYNQESFRHFLSENDINRLDQGIKDRTQDKSKETTQEIGLEQLELFDCRKILQALHPSWIKEEMRSAPKDQRALFEKIGDKIYLSGSIPESLRLLVLSQLFTSSQGQKVPDRKNAEADKLSTLLGKPQEFLELIFCCIGCHFLSVNLRQVIAKKDLDHVVKALDPEAKRYLRKLLFASKKMGVVPLGVKVTTCSQDELKATLRQQGLSIFRQILKAADRDFAWYFLRQFDVEFAHELEASEESHPQVAIEKWIDTVCEIQRYLEEKEA